MTTTKTKTPIGGRPTHPGEILREDILPALGLAKVAVAALLRVSRKHLHSILEEKSAITAPMALRIAKLTGSRPGLWLDLQQAFDLARAEDELADELTLIPELHSPSVAEALPAEPPPLPERRRPERKRRAR